MDILESTVAEDLCLGQAGLSSSPTLSSTSISSSSSSSSSVFSADGQSSQSSAPSSSKTSNLSWDGEANTRHSQVHRTVLSGSNVVSVQENSTYTGTSAYVAPAARTHPRRTTQPSTFYSNVEIGSVVRQPPTLVRQCDRKDNFVESLVDTTTQMIEVIWPLSLVPCGQDTVIGGKNLIGLRTFIQEVLKRSKTSYSTLQVALYYLVLIKPHIPKVDFTNPQPDDSQVLRAMQCGRRMFLAALILASKYLQDRNYSARAWSKICGLKISEVNSNEIAFVKAIDWRLHVPEALFQKWTNIVLKFSQSRSTFVANHVYRAALPSWRAVVPHLTPSLETFDHANYDGIALGPVTAYERESPQGSELASFSYQSYQSTVQPHAVECTESISSLPKRSTLEPAPCTGQENYRFPPVSPYLRQLPTPKVSPAKNDFCAPAVSCIGSCAPGSAMSTTMRQINDRSLRLCTLDQPPILQRQSDFPWAVPAMSSGRAYFAKPTASLVSSPESMISDISTLSRSSRASSVSSMSSAVAPLQYSKPVVSDTRRSAAMNCLKEDGCYKASRHIASTLGLQLTAMTELPGTAQESYVRGFPCPSMSASSRAKDAGSRTSESALLPRHVAGHKRERSSYSTPRMVHDEMHLLLVASKHVLANEKAEYMTCDVHDACTSTLHVDSRLVATDSAALGLLPDMPTSCHDSRKRLCCH